MKYSLIAAALIAAVSAQTGSLPACAITCATGAIAQSGGCGITDYACLCKSQGYLTSFTSCLQSSCSAADLQTAAQIGNAICASAGVTLSSASLTVTATGSAMSSAASSASSAASSVGSSVSSALSSAASSASSASASASSASNSSAAASISSASSRVSSAASSASMAASSVSSAASSAASATSRAAAPTQAFAWELLGLGAAAAAALL